MFVSVFVVCSPIVRLVVLFAVDVIGPIADEEIGIKIQTGRTFNEPFFAVCARKVLVTLSWVRVESILA